MTLVTVGNGRQAFHRLLDAIALMAHQLPQPVVVQSGHTPFSSPAVQVRKFIENEEFLRLLDAATLVISHGGAGTIIQAVRARQLPVVMPRLARHGEVVDDHQLQLAEALGSAGKIVTVLDPSELGDATREALAHRKAGAVPATPRLVSLISRCLDEESQKRGRS